MDAVWVISAARGISLIKQSQHLSDLVLLEFFGTLTRLPLTYHGNPEITSIYPVIIIPMKYLG